MIDAKAPKKIVLKKYFVQKSQSISQIIAAKGDFMRNEEFCSFRPRLSPLAPFFS